MYAGGQNSGRSVLFGIFVMLLLLTILDDLNTPDPSKIPHEQRLSVSRDTVRANLKDKVILDLVRSNEHLDHENRQLQAYALALRKRMREHDVAYADLGERSALSMRMRGRVVNRLGIQRIESIFPNASSPPQDPLIHNVTSVVHHAHHEGTLHRPLHHRLEGLEAQHNESLPASNTRVRAVERRATSTSGAASGDRGVGGTIGPRSKLLPAVDTGPAAHPGSGTSSSQAV